MLKPCSAVSSQNNNSGSSSSTSSSSISSVYQHQQQQMQPDSTVPCVSSADFDHLSSSLYPVGPSMHLQQQQQPVLHQSDVSSAFWYAAPYNTPPNYCYMQPQPQIHHLSSVEDITDGIAAQQQPPPPPPQPQQQQHQQQQQQQQTVAYPTDFSSPAAGKYFWQYNAQGKGPKLACQDRLLQDDRDLSHSDERKVLGFQDPVLRMPAARSDKVRRGNANDIDPRPEELARLGRQLDDLRAQMCHPAKLCDKTEKNKLASRACRLRKKAQHEAFKIKLAGLQAEHTSLVQVLKQGEALLLDPDASTNRAPAPAGKNGLNQCAAEAVTSAGATGGGGYVAALDRLIAAHLTVARVAGRSDQYVLDELDRYSRQGDLQQRQQPHQAQAAAGALDSSSGLSPDCTVAPVANLHLPPTHQHQQQQQQHMLSSVEACCYDNRPSNSNGQLLSQHHQIVS